MANKFRHTFIQGSITSDNLIYPYRVYDTGFLPTCQELDITNIYNEPKPDKASVWIYKYNTVNLLTGDVLYIFPHKHNEYSLINHIHPQYSKLNHQHEFSLINHQHGYALSNTIIKDINLFRNNTVLIEKNSNNQEILKTMINNSIKEIEKVYTKVNGEWKEAEVIF